MFRLHKAENCLLHLAIGFENMLFARCKILLTLKKTDLLFIKITVPEVIQLQGHLTIRTYEKTGFYYVCFYSNLYNDLRTGTKRNC